MVVTTECRRTAKTSACNQCACGAYMYNASTGAPRKSVGDADGTNAMLHRALPLASQYGARATSPMEHMLAWTGRLGEGPRGPPRTVRYRVQPTPTGTQSMHFRIFTTVEVEGGSVEPAGRGIRS